MLNGLENIDTLPRFISGSVLTSREQAGNSIHRSTYEIFFSEIINSFLIELRNIKFNESSFFCCCCCKGMLGY